MISTSEKGVYYRADVKPERDTVVFQVDGYIVSQGAKCDKLILSDNQEDNTWTGHFVELKGGDINHAIEQLEVSVQHIEFQHSTFTKKLARIVGHSFPSNNADSDFEKARNRFRKNYNCELKRLKSMQPDII